MASPPNAVENPAPLYGTAPPDRQATDLRSLFDQCKAVMSRDGGLDDDEMAAAGEFFQWVTAFAQGGGVNPDAAAGQQPQMGGGMESAPEDALQSKGEPLGLYG